MNERVPAPDSLPDALADLPTVLTGHYNIDAHVYARSMQQADGKTYLFTRIGQRKILVIVKPDIDGALQDEGAAFEAEAELAHAAGTLRLCRPTAVNAAALRKALPWTAPQPLGTEPALGCGDRLGLATPGHIRACRAAGVHPVLAQQSIREMERTGRTPQEVVDDVTWAVFQEGYRTGFGADADHLKTEEDVEHCVAAGYTMYTIDPSDHVDNEADELDAAELEARFTALPWEALDTAPSACLERYTATPLKRTGAAGSTRVAFDTTTLQRAAVKYGAAIAHTKRLADHLAACYRTERPGERYDLEMSVDETAHPTRPREHVFVAGELERLGVEVTSLAPRFVGSFEKGIDFIGDQAAFEDSFAQHARIAAAYGDYKLSIHSGSDKFSVYPIMGQHAGERLHLKTAGTSYLEALRIAARHAPGLFREIVTFAFKRFEADRATYHVTTDLNAVPAPEDVADAELETSYLDEPNGRQLLHLTYGSVLTAEGQSEGAFRFKERLFTVLATHEEEHYATLAAHLARHWQGIEQESEVSE